MAKKGTFVLEFFVKFVKLFNNLFYKRNLIIFIGTRGVTLSAFEKSKLVNSIFIDNSSEDFRIQYQSFLKQYKKYHIIFLLDSKHCELKHEIMPVLGSIIKNDPVQRFIQKNYQSEDIIAYNVYEITKNNGEVWHTAIASSPFIESVGEIIEYVIINSFKYSGTYFLSLEFETIIERILQKTKNGGYDNYLQVFAIVTKSSDIKLVVKYKKNILESLTMEYPYDKSDMYVQGVIEQEVEDTLIQYRSFVRKNKLSVCVITVSDTELQELFYETRFDDCSKVIAISDKELYFNSNKFEINRFQDNVILKTFNNFNNHLAFNSYLKSITKLYLVNNMIFKPIIAVIFVLIAVLSTMKYQSIILQNQTIKNNEEYYTVSKEYRNIQKTNPEFKDASDLIELHNLKNLLNMTVITPFDHMKQILSLDYGNLNIKQLSWKISDPQNIGIPKNKIHVAIEYQYEGSKQEVLRGIEVVDGYANRLRSIFPKRSIKYERNPNEVLEVAKKIIIPARVEFEEIINVEKNDK
jgi:hypothetical protein